MGSAAVQGPLWGSRAADWASSQEQTLTDAFSAVFSLLSVGSGQRLLDIGCGAGLATRMAAARGATVTGFDASEELLAIARAKAPDVAYDQGDMEALPYGSMSFDIVTGFNSFQYAENMSVALGEAARVVRKGGRVAMVAWGRPEDCEHAVTLKAIGSFMPPPPPGAPGPFALAVPGAIEALMRAAGLEPIADGFVDCAFSYPDAETAWRGLGSSGPAIKAIQLAGNDAVRDASLASLEPFKTADGGYRQENKFRYVIASA